MSHNISSRCGFNWNYINYVPLIKIDFAKIEYANKHVAGFVWFSLFTDVGGSFFNLFFFWIYSTTASSHNTGIVMQFWNEFVIFCLDKYREFIH
jgi:hypothetical protein